MDSLYPDGIIEECCNIAGQNNIETIEAGSFESTGYDMASYVFAKIVDGKIDHCLLVEHSY